MKIITTKLTDWFKVIGDSVGCLLEVSQVTNTININEELDK